MTGAVLLNLKTDPVTRRLKPPYDGMTVTVRRLRSTEWDGARDAAQTLLRNDAELLPLLAKYDLLPTGGVREWKRMRDQRPADYARYLIGVSMWLTAVECALVGLSGWTGLEVAPGQAAPLDRDTLEALLLDEAISDQIMAVLTEAAQILVIEGKPSGASPNGSSARAKTASAPTTAATVAR